MKPRDSDRDPGLDAAAAAHASTGGPVTMMRLDPAILDNVHGGMRLEGMRQSENVEDRRGLSRRESMRVRPARVPPLVLPPRHPGDLASQAGLDDMDKLFRKRRR